jgi:predicted GIY-YIG superfamily endonuclease
MTISAMELGDETPTALYRLYDAEGVLLYIGISGDLKARFARHAARKPWWPQVARKTVEWHLTRTGAAKTEDAAIKAERPKHNIAGVFLAAPDFDPADLAENAEAAGVLDLAFGEGTTTERLIRITVLALGEVPTGPMCDALADRLRLKPRIVYQATAGLRRRR